MTVSVRYVVNDVDQAIGFYTDLLGFKLLMHPAPAFAALERNELRLLLNKPGAGGGGQSMPDGTSPVPGGWNRIQIEVEDIAARAADLKAKGAKFGSDVLIGIGGDQVIVEDPSGNPIELFEPKRQT